MKFNRILALAAHTDDIELGCGGLLSKFKNTSQIDAVAFSEAQPLSNGSPVNEFKKSMDMVGANTTFMGLKPRIMNEQRQIILDKLWNLNKDVKYDLVLCPASADMHQDHQVIYNECFRAFKTTTIFGYEMVWNTRSFRTDIFVSLNKNQVNEKFNMVDCYKTQGERAFMSKDYIFDIARTRGLQVGHKYAEAYEAIRIVI